MTSTIWTIGHSNHAPSHFFSMLRAAGCNILMDVRSKPFSRFVPHFNRNAIKEMCGQAGVSYIYRGNSLGGLGDHHPTMQTTLEDLGTYLAANPKASIAMMCAEKAPKDCHRHYWLGNFLTMSSGVRVYNILHDLSVVEQHAGTYEGEDLPPWLEYKPWRARGEGVTLPYAMQNRGWVSEESARKEVESYCGAMAKDVAFFADETVLARMQRRKAQTPQSQASLL